LLTLCAWGRSEFRASLVPAGGQADGFLRGLLTLTALRALPHAGTAPTSERENYRSTKNFHIHGKFVLTTGSFGQGNYLPPLSAPVAPVAPLAPTPVIPLFPIPPAPTPLPLVVGPLVVPPIPAPGMPPAPGVFDVPDPVVALPGILGMPTLTLPAFPVGGEVPDTFAEPAGAPSPPPIPLATITYPAFASAYTSPAILSSDHITITDIVLNFIVVSSGRLRR
jgi:hypothetical protein